MSYVLQNSDQVSKYISQELKGGTHSDIAVYAFGKRYELHKLILGDSTYFKKILQGLPSHSTEIKVKFPYDTDIYLTQSTFKKGFCLGDYFYLLLFRYL